MKFLPSFAALSALALLSMPLRAQQATPPAASSPTPGAPASAALPLADALQGAAKQAYESAKLLATNKDFGGALAEFRQAYTYSKDPRLLFNMAICEKELHHYAKMRGILDQYLRDGVGVASPESLASAQDALSAIKPLVAALQLKVSEPGAEVSVDGEVIGSSPVTDRVPVDLGRHTIAVKKSGFDPYQQTLETPGGTEAVVQITLVAQKHLAQLLVSAGPDAVVVIDGSLTGQQGRFDGAVSAGAHEVSVTAQGKRPYKAQVELRDGETRTLQVTLEDEEHGGGSAWPWVIGGAVVAAGAAVGGYFLFKPQDTTTPVPAGKIPTVNLMVWRP
jgi:hypothetical protein